MNEQLALLRQYLHILWLYRWQALLVAALVCLVGWPVVVALPNQYEVSAKIWLDTRSVLRPLLKGLAVDTTVLQDTALILRKTLLTRPNLEEVAHRTDLHLKARNRKEMETLLQDLARKVQVKGRGGRRSDNIFTITYRDSDPVMAARVVEELLNIFMEKALGSTREDTAVAERFLNEQIAEYKRRLERSEDRLKEFKRKNAGLMPSEGKTYYARIAELDSQIAEIGLQLREYAQRRGQLRRQIAQVESAVATPPSEEAAAPRPSPLEQQIAQTRTRLDQLLQQYTEKHPDVIATRRILAELEARRKQERREVARDPQRRRQALVDNKLYQDLSVELSKVESELAALRARKEEFQKRRADLKRQADTIPEIEAELTRLTRDYGLNKQQYEELVKRRESAKLSKSAEQTADDIKLNIIDPPRVPVLPVGPKRLLLYAAVFLGGLGLGGGLAWLFGQLKPRIFTSEELKRHTGLPVVGTVSLGQSPWETGERRMELAVYGLVFLLLLACYAGLSTLELMHYDLHGRLLQLLKEHLA